MSEELRQEKQKAFADAINEQRTLTKLRTALHAAFRELGYTTNGQTSDLLDIVFDAFARVPPGAAISTQHGPWVLSALHEGETYCQRCLRHMIDVSHCISKYLTVSTAHIPARTDDALRISDNADLESLVYETLECAWLINLFNPEVVPLLALAGHPELAKVMQLAIDADCTHLRLDADGAVIDGLPIFSW